MRKLILTISLATLPFLAVLDLVAAQPRQFTVELIQTFDYPNSGFLINGIGGINGRGDIVGTIAGDGYSAGFVRFRGGTFSRPLSFPHSMQTFLTGVSAERVSCGYYAGRDGGVHGFLDAANGFTSYDAPGATNTYIESVNDSADFAGNYQPPSGPFSEGFVSLGGIFNTIEIPEASGTLVGGINNQGKVTGIYLENDFLTGHGFLRAPDGTLTYRIDFPGSNVLQTDLEAINDEGFVVGGWVDDFGVQHGLVLRLPDTFVSFDVAGGSLALTVVLHPGIAPGEANSGRMRPGAALPLS